jgi:hypothetical protein
VDGVCGACGAGTYAAGGKTYACTDCVAGATYQDAAQASECKACQTCRAGWYQVTTCTTTANRVCGACPAGKYSATDGLTACQACSAGTFQDRANATGCKACQFCPAGYSWGESCSATSDAVCARCAAGTFNPSNLTSGCTRCAAGTFQEGTGATKCKACVACTANRYLISGCDGVSDGVCATCTVCPSPQGTVRACGNATDTVCGNASSCALSMERALGVYDWIRDAQRCQAGKYLLAYDPTAGTKDCRPCPVGWAGLNGVYCERCGALEEPYYLDRSSCVCKAPAVMNASGACVCPDGFAQASNGGGFCAPCGRNQYGLRGACWACGAGTFTVGTGATACEACEFGKFREAGGQQLECQACPLQGWYAPDTRAGDCIPCNTTCAMPGWQWARRCPGDATGGYSVCEECAGGGGLPGNATWGAITVDPATGDRALGGGCAYDCLEGFYHTEDGRGCAPCTLRGSIMCPAGWDLSPCTAYADSNCDKVCVDATKPTFYLHWVQGFACPWECDEGYELRVWDYVMFLLRECTPIAGAG